MRPAPVPHRVLVTGATSRLGLAVVRECVHRGHSVVAISRSADDSDLARMPVRAESVDLTTDTRRLSSIAEDCDAVIHLAGQSDEDVERSSFVTGTQHLLVATQDSKVARFVLASSISVYDYDRIAPFAEITEESPTVRSSSRSDAYARCKLRQEELVAEHAADVGISSLILRIGSVVDDETDDPEDDASSPTPSPRLGLRLPGGWLIGPRHSALPLIRRSDAAAAIVRAATAAVPDGATVANVVGFRQPTPRQHADGLRSRGTRARRVSLPWWTCRVLGVVAQALRDLRRGRFPSRHTLLASSVSARLKPVRFTHQRAIDLGLASMPKAGGPSDGPPRIAYLTGEYPRATDTFIQREVAGLRSVGFDVRTFSVRRTSTQHHVGAEQKEEAARTTSLLPVRPIRLIGSAAFWLIERPLHVAMTLGLALQTARPGLQGLIYQLFYFAEALMLSRDLARLGVRHLHNHFSNSSCSVAMLASNLSGIPFSFTAHGPAIFFEPKLWCLGEKVRSARFVSCISYFCRSQVMAFSRVDDWPRLKIIHCGVEPDRYRRGDRTDETIELLFVGRLAAVKGVPVLLDAMTQLDERFRLTIIGDGELRETVEAYVNRFGLSERVTLPGFLSQTEVADALREHDIFVMASFAEGVPVVLMEAAASEVAVIAPRIAGIGELVEDGQSGILVSPGSVENLRDAISRLAEDPVARQSMGERGRQIIERDFDVRIEADRLGRLFLASDDEIRPRRLSESLVTDDVAPTKRLLDESQGRA